MQPGNMRRRRVAGYLTVEAALVLPVALLVICLVIYLGIYQYDRCIAQQDVQIAVLRASGMIGATTQEARIRMEDALRAESEEMIGQTTWSVQTDADLFSVSVQAKGGLVTIGPQARIVGSSWGFTAQSSAGRFHPTAILRTSRLVEEAIP